MPLASPQPRKLLHTRRVEYRGFEREDGLWDIEGRIVDSKAYSSAADWRGRIAAGEPVHDMSVRLTVTTDLMVEDARAVTDASPYSMCADANAGLSVLKGMRVGPGWVAEVKRRLGGAKSCTHVLELLGPVVTTASQTLVIVRREQPDKLRPDGRPAKIDTCVAYERGSELIKRCWPAHYESPADARAEEPQTG